MASGGDDVDGAGTAARRKKRISDCLGDSDGDEAAPASPSSPGTPRLRLPGFTCARFRFVRIGRRRGGGGGRKEAAGAVGGEKSEAASVNSSGAYDMISSRPAGGGSGGAKSESGVALSLLFFLAKASVELNKMAGVRAEMEALLKEMREQARSKSTDHLVVPRTRSLDTPSTTTASSTSTRASDADTNGLATSSSAMDMASSSARTCEDDDDDERSGRLEAEQEASEPSDDEFIELEGGLGFGGGGRTRWDSEVGSADDEERGGGGGVAAAELERRLHEVLHERNWGRIAALEAALRRTERKAVEKEMEARLWRDTAKLALQPQQQEQEP